MSDTSTVLYHGASKYAVTCTPEQAMQLAERHSILRLEAEGQHPIFIRSSAISHATTWDLPSHHGVIWNLSPGGGQQPPQQKRNRR